jgi:hypothetical protein
MNMMGGVRQGKTESLHTTMVIPTHCTSPLKTKSEATIFHPALLRCTPPEMMTPKLTRVASSTTTEKSIRKPTVLQRLQNVFLPAMHHASCGKDVHVAVPPVQRLWRPRDISRLSFCGEVVSEGAMMDDKTDDKTTSWARILRLRGVWYEDRRRGTNVQD